MQKSTLSGRYELLGQLGNGGMAEVYLAHDSVLDRDVAVKILHAHLSLDDDFVERFRREARSAASLQHPNIVQVYDQGWDDADGTHFIAMEYVSGGTLKDIIRKRGALEPREAAGMAASISRALHMAHTRGIIHRDIKPQNVLIDSAGQPKVADFGIARAASSATTAMTGTVMGTAGYMSPEQALGEKVSARSDQYSLGVMLYEMLAGELPHDADTPVAIAVKHVNEIPRPPGKLVSGLPAGLDALTMKLLSKKPEDRYPDANALADDLARVRDGLAPKVSNIPAGTDVTSRTTAATRETSAIPAGAAGATTVIRDGNADENTSVLPRSAAGRGGGRGSSSGMAGRRRGRKRIFGVLAVVALLLVFGAAFAAMDALRQDATESVAAEGQERPGTESGAASDSGSDTPDAPDVVGMNLDEARAELEEARFDVTVERTESNDEEAGTVMEQSSGDGREVVLTVGDGPEMVATPNLIYASEAEAQLSEADLALGEITESYSSTVAEGVIISQNPANGEEVEPGTEVDITVSLGPEPAPVEPAPTETAPTQAAPSESPEPAPVEEQPVVDEPVTEEPVAEEPVTGSEPSSGTSSQPSSPGGEIVDDVFEDVGIE